LTFEESKAAFEILMDGKASDNEIFDFLTLLSAKGEVSDEIAGGVYILRNKSKRVNVQNCIDTCGTGGDGKNTLKFQKLLYFLQMSNFVYYLIFLKIFSLFFIINKVF
jgi:anthranilate phosphoribosyltransferase